MEISNLVVARYADGRVLKGVTQDFSPNRGIFHIHPPGDDRNATQLRFKQLKALFFVSSLDGDPSREDLPGFVAGPAETQQGKKIAVRFKDGEFICGYTLSWTPEREGFFMFPADPNGNNQRIFVITAATAEVKAGPAAEVLAQRALSTRRDAGVLPTERPEAGGSRHPLPWERPAARPDPEARTPANRRASSFAVAGPSGPAWPGGAPCAASPGATGGASCRRGPSRPSCARTAWRACDAGGACRRSWGSRGWARHHDARPGTLPVRPHICKRTAAQNAVTVAESVAAAGLRSQVTYAHSASRSPLARCPS